MKNGVKKNKFLENIVIATVYFMIFCFFILLTGQLHYKSFSNPTILNLISYWTSIIAMLVFLVLFVSAWEDCFESEDHP